MVSRGGSLFGGCESFIYGLVPGSGLTVASWPEICGLPLS